jgi:hypothetical protein
MTTAPSPSVLVPDELMRMMALVGQSDSVELKLTLPASAYRPAARALGVDPLEAQIRQVYFFDTPDLALNGAGVVARARRIQGRDGDSTIKLRPIEPSEVDDVVRSSPQFGIEVDAMPGGYVCSGSMKNAVASADVLAASSGERPLHKLFTKAQRSFYAAHAPAGLALDDLAVLGPILVLKLKMRPKGFVGRMVAEMWIYPDGSRVVELSTKATPSESLNVAMHARQYLQGLGIPLSGEQATKTKTALEFFAAELAGSPS